MHVKWFATISVLAAGAAAGGAAAGAAHAAVPHAGSDTARILKRVETHNGATVGRTTELQYFTPQNLYQLVRQYDGNRVSSVQWQKEALGKRRSVDSVNIDAGRRTWFEQKRTVPPLAPHSLGIRSSTAEVARAIREGEAAEDGFGRRDGQRVRLLKLHLGSPDVRDAELWVNPSTDQPVSESVTFAIGKVRSRTLRSDWQSVSPAALARLEAKPMVPAGYKVVRPN